MTGDLNTAEQTCALWGRAYPRSEKPHLYLSGAIYPQTGQYEKAVEEGKEAVRLNSESPIPYAFLMFGYITVNRFDHATAVYQQAVENKLDSPFSIKDFIKLPLCRTTPRRWSIRLHGPKAS